MGCCLTVDKRQRAKAVENYHELSFMKIQQIKERAVKGDVHSRWLLAVCYQRGVRDPSGREIVQHHLLKSREYVPLEVF